MNTLVEVYTAHVEDDFRLATRFSKSPRNKEMVEMLWNQAFGAVEGIVVWLNYQRDPDNIAPALIKMWDEYNEKFKQLLEK